VPKRSVEHLRQEFSDAGVDALEIPVRLRDGTRTLALVRVERFLEMAEAVLVGRPSANNRPQSEQPPEHEEPCEHGVRPGKTVGCILPVGHEGNHVHGILRGRHR
jgi:hypothetical protein